MRILAQHGYGPKDKLSRGLEEGILDGVVFSPRYWKPERMRDEIEALQASDVFLAMDPEFYASAYISHPTSNLGALEEWEYFRSHRRAALISGSAIPPILYESTTEQIELGLNHVIAPNVYVKQADSIETAIAINFLNATSSTCSEITDVPVYATIAIHRDAIVAGHNFRDLLDGLTGVDNPPDGYYIIVGSSEQQSTGKFIRSDLSQPEVIAGWMYANYVFSLNGADVINGYCFLLGPLLGLCGAGGSASGWSSGLRKFCIDRYVRSHGRGGRAPNVRYVSNPLMAHVKQTDLDAFAAIHPDIMNDLPYDDVYDQEPSRTEEALQAWQALRFACESALLFGGSLSDTLDDFCALIEDAKSIWANLQSVGLSNEAEPNLERLYAMEQGIELFREWAELP